MLKLPLLSARSSAGLERILAEDEVVGSNPIGRTTEKSCLFGGIYFAR